MILGVDASNVRAGGGLTHLRELLAAAEPESHGFERVVVWGGRKTLDALSRRPWLALHHIAALDRPLPLRLAWQHVDLPIRARLSCDVLFSPGGLALTPFRPRVLVSQNMLPFELRSGLAMAARELACGSSYWRAGRRLRSAQLMASSSSQNTRVAW